MPCKLPGVEPDELLKGGSDRIFLFRIGDDDNGVTVEVGPRQTLSHLAVDADCVSCLTDQLLGSTVVVVDRQLGDLELSAMG